MRQNKLGSVPLYDPFSTNSGEVLQDTKHILFFDKDRLIEEEKYDGYYAIGTSELDTEDEQVNRDVQRALEN